MNGNKIPVKVFNKYPERDSYFVRIFERADGSECVYKLGVIVTDDIIK
jgi:hypothetical protein